MDQFDSNKKPQLPQLGSTAAITYWIADDQ